MKKTEYRKFAFCLLLTLIFVFSPASELYSQTGRVVRQTLRAKSLQNTVTKENPERNVSVYLPPSYDSFPDRRYPVIFLLHGIADTDQTWTRAWTKDNDGYSTIQEAMNKGIAEGKFGEMIIVMPDQKTNWFGSFYVNSSVTGNWEDFTSKELVNYIDANYRTMPKAKNRGIGGHSMGGYGAITISMKHPDIFSAAYGLNPAIIDWGGDLTIANPAFEFVLNAKSFEEVGATRDIYKMGFITVAQAFSPNPEKPPFYADFPYKMHQGTLVPEEKAFTKWREHSAIHMVEKYRANLMQLRGLRFDSGYQDEFGFIPVNSRALSAELTNNAVPHTFEEYNGDHRNRLWGKRGRIMTEVLPYFWELLKP